MFVYFIFRENMNSCRSKKPEEKEVYLERAEEGIEPSSFISERTAQTAPRRQFDMRLKPAPVLPLSLSSSFEQLSSSVESERERAFYVVGAAS